MSILRYLFARVVYTCVSCGATQKIPLRRIHVFERFHRLTQGEPVLIRCPECDDGVQIPSPYTTHTGHHVALDPEYPPDNAFIHADF